MKKCLWMMMIWLCGLGIAKAQTYHVGDLIFNTNDGTHGVVFWVSLDGSYGWMMAMKNLEVVEANTIRKRFSWGSVGVNIPNLPDTKFTVEEADNACNWSIAQHDTAGYEHTRTLIDFHRNVEMTKLPYKYIDFASGWFIPSAAQAQRMILMAAFTDSTLVQNGGEPIGESWHWTSSEYDQGTAYQYFYGNGMLSFSGAKAGESPIRLIRHFFNPVEISIDDTSYRYTWNTGQETSQIEVTPTENTVYSVKITTATFCEREVTKQIYVSSPDIQEINDTVCIGHAYERNGFVLAAHRNQSTGLHSYDTTLMTDACQVNLHLNLLTRDTVSTLIDTAFCEGYSYKHNGVIYADSGSFVQRLAGINSCDSIVRLNLEMRPNSFNTIQMRDTVYHTWNDVDYMATGLYQQHFKALNGCDSTVTLDLTIVEVFVDTVFHVDTIRDSLYACQGKLPIQYYGQTISSFGAHELVPNDSTLIYLKLKSHPVFNAVKNLDSCDRVNFNDRNYTRDTAFKLVYQTVHGCDSSFDVSIGVRKSTKLNLFIDSCDRVTFEDDHYYRDTVLQRVYLNSDDCDSVVNIRLTVMQNTDQTVEIKACDSVEYRGQWYYDSTQVVNTLVGATCTSTLTANLSVAKSNYEYLNFDVCDSIVYEGHRFIRDTILYRYHLNWATCDSVAEVQITLRHSTAAQTMLEACKFVDYKDHRYLRDTVLSEHYLNSENCDSIQHVVIHVKESNLVVERIDSLGRITYDGREYFEDTVIENYLVNIYGCDSVHRVELYVRQMDSAQIVVYWGKVLALSNPNNLEVLKTAHYEWFRDGQALSSNRAYVEVGMPIPPGNYRVVASWDQGVLVCERRFEELVSRAIYPNPASQGQTVTLEMPKAVRSIEVYHNDGRLLFRIPKFRQMPPSFEAPMAPGVYLVMVYFEDQSSETHKCIVR